MAKVINIPLPGDKCINIQAKVAIKLTWDDVEAAWEGLQVTADNKAGGLICGRQITGQAKQN